MSSSDINDVANFLILEKNYSISHRQLQKILYFSQGFYLSQYGEPLFESNMDAWKFGPVNPSIWGRFKNFGGNCLYVSDELSTVTLSDTKKQFLIGILASFLVLGETMLIDMSHTDYPWGRNYIQGFNKVIDKSLIEDYFKEFDSQEEYIKAAKVKVEFSQLLTQRKAYLSSLDQIGDNWISGGAVAPTKEICTACKQFLHDFERNLFSRYAAPKIPKLIMGPIPTGGVGIELYLSDINLYVHFHNNKQIEISIETNGEFMEYDIALDAFSEEIGLFLERIA